MKNHHRRGNHQMKGNEDQQSGTITNEGQSGGIMDDSNYGQFTRISTKWNCATSC